MISTRADLLVKPIRLLDHKSFDEISFMRHLQESVEIPEQADNTITDSEPANSSTVDNATDKTSD